MIFLLILTGGCHSRNSIAKFAISKLCFSFVLDKLNSSKAKVSYIGGLGAIFLLIYAVNLVGLLGYTFSIRAIINFNIIRAVLLWASSSLVVWAGRPKKALFHLTPRGTPLGLVPLIVGIELIRSLIRPLTLSLRLTANIVAGHLILSLIYHASPASSTHALVLTVVRAVIFVLELAVGLVQAYIFSTLLALYRLDN